VISSKEMKANSKQNLNKTNGAIVYTFGKWNLWVNLSSISLLGQNTKDSKKMFSQSPVIVMYTFVFRCVPNLPRVSTTPT
jgi:hypothetical protein